MLVLANGAPKSGSTWLYEIVKRLLSAAPMPDRYLMPAPEDPPPGYEPLVAPQKLPELIKSGATHSHNYVSKTHLFAKRYVRLLLADSSVRILDIHRDVRDALVSHYHDMIRTGHWSEAKGFERYYWSIGRYKSYQVRQFHRAWAVNSPQVYVSSFERLKSDFPGEVKRIAEFLGLKLNDDQVEQIREQTSLGQLRKAWAEEGDARPRFFRKGTVGEWKSVFKDEMLRDLDAIQQKGLRGVSLLRYHLLFTLRQAIMLSLAALHVPWIAKRLGRV